MVLYSSVKRLENGKCNLIYFFASYWTISFLLRKQKTLKQYKILQKIVYRIFKVCRVHVWQEMEREFFLINVQKGFGGFFF